MLVFGNSTALKTHLVATVLAVYVV